MHNSCKPMSEKNTKVSREHINKHRSIAKGTQMYPSKSKALALNWSWWQLSLEWHKWFNKKDLQKPLWDPQPLLLRPPSPRQVTQCWALFSPDPPDHWAKLIHLQNCADKEMPLGLQRKACACGSSYPVPVCMAEVNRIYSLFIGRFTDLILGNVVLKCYDPYSYNTV